MASLVAGAAVAQGPARRLRDLNPSTVTRDGSWPGFGISTTTGLLFSTSDWDGQGINWVADGTGVRRILEGTPAFVAGGRRVPGPGASHAELNGRTLLVAYDNCGGTQVPNELLLLSTDGTDTGTTRLATFPGLPADAYVQDLTTFGSGVYFTAFDPVAGQELWTTDGTAAGTARFMDLRPGTGGSSPFVVGVVNGWLVFMADDGTSGREPWVTDGTLPGTQLLADITAGSASTAWVPQGGVSNGLLFFSAGDAATGSELWCTNGTSAGTRLVRDIEPGPGSSNPAEMVDMGGTLYFAAGDGVAGAELWRSDGTFANTVRVLDGVAGPNDSFPRSLIAMGGALFYLSDDPSTGCELWRSDGTAAGTVMVKDTMPGPDGQIYQMTAGLGKLFLMGIPGGDPGTPQFFTSDGTAAGTLDFESAYPFPPGFRAMGLPMEWGGRLFLSGDDGSTGIEPWTTDGTATGTHLVADLQSILTDAVIFTPVAAGGRLVFAQRMGMTFRGSEDWMVGSSEGTTATTQRFGPHRVSAWNPWLLPAGDAALYLEQGDGATDRGGLWHTDGTVAGTTRLASPQLTYADMTVLGNTIYLAASTPATGDELFKVALAGGTPALVADVEPGPSGSMPRILGAAGGYVFFFVSGASLMATDGTSAGTVTLVDGSVVPQLPLPGARFRPSASWRDRLFFLDWDPDHGLEPWLSDGTVSGTAMLSDIWPGPSDSSSWWYPQFTVARDRLFFVASDGTTGYELWSSDGTSTALVRDINPDQITGLSPDSLASMGDWVILSTDDGVLGREPWRSDGTLAGTALVADIAPGSACSEASGFTRLPDGRAVFVADDGSTGLEPWITDGTAAGTRLIQDLAPGSASSDPLDFVVAGNVLYFTADPLHVGRELWAMTLSSGTLRGSEGGPSGTALRVSRQGSGDLVLAWDRSCVATDTDFVVHEGTIGDFSGHRSVACGTAGVASWTLTPSPGATYYLVAPSDGVLMGSFGTRSDGQERPVGISTCFPQVTGTCGP